MERLSITRFPGLYERDSKERQADLGHTSILGEEAKVEELIQHQAKPPNEEISGQKLQPRGI